MNKTVQKAIRVEYAVVRTPFTLLEQHVLTHLGQDSRVRSTVGRAVGVIDQTYARLSGKPAAAASRASVPDAPEISVEEVEQLAEELLEQQETQHQLAGELAEDDELRRVQAELKAKHTVERRLEG